MTSEFAQRSGGLTGFLAEAVGRLRNRRIVFPAVMMLLLLTFSNIVLLLNLPKPGQLPSVAAIVAIGARLLGLAVIGVALLRTLAGSSRPAWRLDGALLLYIAATLVSLAVGSLLAELMGSSREPISVLTRSIVTAIVLAPFAPWLVGIAVAVPLGWNPRRFMRDFGRWLPPLILWALLIVTPLGVAHALLDFRLMEGIGQVFWPVALADGVLSLCIVLIGFALNVTAYRHVARD